MQGAVLSASGRLLDTNRAILGYGQLAKPILQPSILAFLHGRSRHAAVQVVDPTAALPHHQAAAVAAGLHLQEGAVLPPAGEAAHFLQQQQQHSLAEAAALAAAAAATAAAAQQQQQHEQQVRNGLGSGAMAAWGLSQDGDGRAGFGGAEAAAVPSTHAATAAAAAGAQAGAVRNLEPGDGSPALLPEKTCMHCGGTKPVSSFRGSNSRDDRLQNRCKVWLPSPITAEHLRLHMCYASRMFCLSLSSPRPPCKPALSRVPQDCEAELGWGAKRDKGAAPVVKVSHKLCRRCGQDKAAPLFFTSKTSLDGLCTYCKVSPSARLHSSTLAPCPA